MDDIIYASSKRFKTFSSRDSTLWIYFYTILGVMLSQDN